MESFKVLKEGVRKKLEGGGFVIDYTYDAPEDIIRVAVPEIHQSSIAGNPYYFGYQFEPTADSKTRTAFLRWIKGLDSDSQPTESQLRQFLEKPIALLRKQVPLSSFSGLVYPLSQRSDLAGKIANSIVPYTQSETFKGSFQLIKNLPEKIFFDWVAFDADYEATGQGEIGDRRYQQIWMHVEDELLPKIHSLDYFSIAQSTKAKYRRYLRNYLRVQDIKDLKMLKAIQAGRLLVVDDVDSTKSTLNEILHVIDSINPYCEIFVYTLIGKE